MDQATISGPSDAEPLLKAAEVARRLALEEHTLAVWRCTGRHLPFVKVGNSVRYRSADVAAFIANNLQAA